MKKNEIKAVKFLGKYAQNKGLFNEVIKTLDWLDEEKKKNKKEITMQNGKKYFIPG